jgi:hypothetical protein
LSPGLSYSSSCSGMNPCGKEIAPLSLPRLLFAREDEYRRSAE